MTWSGEDPASGVMIFTEDGSPGSVIGTDGQILTWTSGTPAGSEAKFLDASEAVGIDIDFVNNIQASGAANAVYAVADSIPIISTIGLLFTQVSGMVIETPPSGTYVVFFNADVTADKSSREIQIAVFAGGTVVDSSVRNLTSESANQEAIISTAGVAVDVNGSEDIDIRIKRIGQSASWTIGGRTLSAFLAINNV